MARVPQWHQVGVVRAAGLAALAGRVDGDRLIPVAGVKNLAIARARNLYPGISVSAGGIHRVFVTRTRQSTEVEQIFRAGLLVERVAEVDGVQSAPRPLRGVGTQELLELFARRSQ